MKYIPLADRIIVEPAEENRVTPGGIIVPDVAVNHKHLAFGTVIAVGAGRVNAEGRTVPLTVKAGDTVAFPRRAVALIPIIHEDGSEETQIMLREAEVVAIVEDLPRPTSIRGLDGRILAMTPASRGLPDSVYENREAMAVAVKEGWAEPEEAVDEAEPGDARLD